VEGRVADWRLTIERTEKPNVSGVRGPKSKPTPLDARLRTPDIGLSLQWAPTLPAQAGFARVTSLAGVTAEPTGGRTSSKCSIPTMLMKTRGLSDGAREFSIACLKTKLLSFKHLICLRFGRGCEKKDVK
jgi:hypothetical protein